jgi:hypothetical protein
MWLGASCFAGPDFEGAAERFEEDNFESKKCNAE